MIEKDEIEKIVLKNVSALPNKDEAAKNIALEIRVMSNKQKRESREYLTFKVITETIMFDNLVKEIIKEAVGLERDLVETDSSVQLVNEEFINRFENYFLQELGWFSKLKILNETLKDREGEGLGDRFGKDFEELYKIRNIFAHSLQPKNVSKKDKKPIAWKELATRHSKMYNELILILFKKFYKNTYVLDK